MVYARNDEQKTLARLRLVAVVDARAAYVHSHDSYCNLVNPPDLGEAFQSGRAPLKNTTVKYIQSPENSKCIIVSNFFPRHKSDE
jgi:hypothetical protein